MSNRRASGLKMGGGNNIIPMIMGVDTTDVTSSQSGTDSIILPFDEGNTVNLEIDWGDGTPLEPYTNTNNICSHQYAIGGFYDIKIYNLDGVSRIPWNMNNVATSRRDYSKFYDLKQFGDCEIYQLDSTGDIRSFYNCRNLDVTATDIGERCVELCINAFQIFTLCDIVEAKNSSNWQTSGITVFSGMFQKNTNIIIDCSNWEMSQAIGIDTIFNECGNLNPDVTNWDISINCETLFASFNLLSNFERNLSNWDVSGVTNMQITFKNCTSFTGQGLETWVTSALTNLASTFQSCTSLTTLNLSSWDVSGVTTMLGMFSSCTNFVGNGLDSWNTSSALTNLQATFKNCRNLTTLNLSSWDVSGVTTMVELFKGCTNFVGNGLDSWVTSALTNLSNTFNGCVNFNQDLSNWDFSNVTNMPNFGNIWGMDTNNYDKLLLSLASQTLQPNLTNVRMSSQYTSGEVANGVTDSVATNKLMDSTQNFTSSVNVGDVIFNTTQDIYAEVLTVDSNTELTLDLDIMALGDSYSVEGSNVAKARYFVVKTYNWEIIDNGQI